MPIFCGKKSIFRLSWILSCPGWEIGNLILRGALIVRPGQRFLLTEEEIREFLRGYASEGTFQKDLVRYYMVLIYSFFYKMGETEYQSFVRSFLQQNIR